MSWKTNPGFASQEDTRKFFCHDRCRACRTWAACVHPARIKALDRAWPPTVAPLPRPGTCGPARRSVGWASANAILIPNGAQQLRNLGFRICGQRQQRQARRTAVISVQVLRVFDSRHSVVADDSLRSLRDPLLLLLRELGVAVFPSRINLEACGRGGRSEGHHSADGADLERLQHLVRRAAEDLKACVFSAGLEFGFRGDR